MKCPQCNSTMRTLKISIQDAQSPVISNQCPKCGYFDFEQKSIAKAVVQIKVAEQPLTVKQKIIKLSKGRLGMYINQDIARSLNLKGGEDVYLSLPDKKSLLVNIEG